ncbi:HPr(Ser) kinase/phosphatase [candidate division WOR-3 bacterium]|nr:HPr(Ser) kinase/phosphatase [candidate division WOR-3 bacterium]
MSNAELKMNVRDICKILEPSCDVIAGKAGLDNKIKNGLLYFPELLITGFEIETGRESIQILSYDAIKYLKENQDATKNILKPVPPCVLIPSDPPPTPTIVKICEQSNTPLLVTYLSLSDTKTKIEESLDREFAPFMLMHGTFIDVSGMGVLLTGETGIGKTECALDLIFRGHRLIADDVVRVEKTKDNRLEGTGIEKSKRLKYHIEIRGIGILDIQRIFGTKGVRERKGLELIVHLYEQTHKRTPEITGIEIKTTKILDVETTAVDIPLVPGKNISALIEIVALNKLLQLSGTNSAKEFEAELIRVMKERRA